MYKLIFFAALSFIPFYSIAQDTTQQIVAGRVNNAAQMQKPYLILISADGFRYDYAEKFDAKNLLRLSSSGVAAKSMKASFPSLTFPNHYSIATGLYPAHHGLVNNSFYEPATKEFYSMSAAKAVNDPHWYGGTPLWVLAEQQGMLSASYFFVGSEVPIQNTRPTYWYKYNERTPIGQRIDALINWLKMPEETRPHFISFYFSEVDHEAHSYGPEADQTIAAIHFVDSVMGIITARVDGLGLPVNYIFLSDHGMAQVDTTTRINIPNMLDTSKFIFSGGSTSLSIYAKEQADILPAYQVLKQKENNFTAYLKKDIPARWHFNAKEDRYNRIGDIFVVPDYPKVLSSWSGRIKPGAHGFDPDLKVMYASFYAWGPQIKKGKKIGSFKNVDVYPIVCKLLGLQMNSAVDGSGKPARKILKK